MGKDVLDIEVGNLGGGNGLEAGNEDGGFGAVVVSNGEDTIESCRRQEFDDEVHGNVFEAKGGVVSGDGVMRHAGSGHDGPGGLAGGASADKGGDKVFHVGPPVVFCKKEISFKDTGVAGSRGVMV